MVTTKHAVLPYRSTASGGREHVESHNLMMPKITIVVGKGQRLNSCFSQSGEDASAQRAGSK